MTSTTTAARVSGTLAKSGGQTDMKLEVIVISVSDVDHAKQFYTKLGWRLDADLVFGRDSRVVQLTPPGSACSIHLGNMFATEPGSARAYLVVDDIQAAKRELEAAGAQVSGYFHPGPDGPVEGLDPERKSYSSRAMFNDPDGNSWILQEVTTRFPGRIDPGVTSYASENDLVQALIRAATAHGKHEASTGKHDEEWPLWYAAYMAGEQSGAKLPE